MKVTATDISDSVLDKQKSCVFIDNADSVSYYYYSPKIYGYMVLVWDIHDLQLPHQLAGDTSDYGVGAVTSCSSEWHNA